MPQAPEARRFRPFCSRRCADIDLSRWLNGAYAIPSSEDDETREWEYAREEDGALERDAPPHPRLRH